MNTPYDKLAKIYTNIFGHMTKMATMPIYSINLLKLFFYVTRRPMTLGLGMYRVPTRQGKVREICFIFKVREKSGNSVKWSGKFGNLQKSGKSQEILKSYCSNTSKIEQTNMR